MKHLHGRPRNSLWRIINTWAFAVHYHAVLCGGSIPFRSGRDRREIPGLVSYAGEIFVDRLALSRWEDELSSIQRLLRLRFGSFSEQWLRRAYVEFPEGKSAASISVRARVILCGIMNVQIQSEMRNDAEY